MALRTAVTARTETEANKPVNNDIQNSSIVSDIDNAVLVAESKYKFTTDICVPGREEKGVTQVKQSDSTYVKLDDLLTYISEQGYNQTSEIYKTSAGLLVKIKIGW